jgi:hypothetical protein
MCFDAAPRVNPSTMSRPGSRLPRWPSARTRRAPAPMSWPCFGLCANTARNAQASLADYQAKWPDTSADEIRWNSGDYDSAVTPRLVACSSIRPCP